MAKQIRKKPTKSFSLSSELLDVIKAWAERSGKSDSDVIRLCLAEGLKVLAGNPDLLGPPPVNPADVTPPQPVMRKGKPTATS